MTDRDFDSNDYEALLALDGDISEQGHGASSSEIDRFPAYDVDSSANSISCSVCLEGISVGERARILPCMHQFHVDCIDTWLKMHASCPVCKIMVL